MRRIHFSSKAKEKMQRQLIWYAYHRNNQFASTFSRNLSKDIRILASMPTIGTKAYLIDGVQYHKFPSKKKTTIYYWFDDTDIYIENIVFYFEGT